jgi:PEP-CTERM motif
MVSTLETPRTYRFGAILDASISRLIGRRHADPKTAWIYSILTPTRWAVRLLLGAVLSGALLGEVHKAQADSIAFQLASGSITTTSSGTVLFLGTVTNDSGSNLNATDFFFNFFGFDPASVTPSQELGIATDFPIPNGTTSATVGLFDVRLGSVPAGSSFPIQVQLEDINSDLSAVQTVVVSSVPEPSSMFMLMLGTGMLGVLAAARRKHNSASN